MSDAIISALSEAKNRDITEHECILYDNIDADALDKLFRTDGNPNSIKVEFTTHDAIVVIWGNGQFNIEVQDFETR